MQDHAPNEVENPREQPSPNRYGLTRHDIAEVPVFDESKPRLGRRESEPHSAEVSYLYDILTTNFPESKTTWDLHHYFSVDIEGEDIPEECDIQFDISYFHNFQIPVDLPSYNASEHGFRVPDMVVNVLSRSTWRKDFSDNMETCKLLKIPLYIVFTPYHVAKWQYRAPFLRAYYFDVRGEYTPHDLRVTLLEEGGTINPDGYEDKIIDTSELVPFRVALMKKKRKYKGGLPEYRVVLIDPKEPRLLVSSLEKAKEQAKQEKERAEQEKERAEQEKERAEQEKERADREKARAENAEALLIKYKDKFGNI
ncbi:MAG: hypothetical protein ACTSUE_01300 [Promethearchaeota archaeon]